VNQSDIAVYDKKHVAVFYDSSTRMVQMKWKGFATSVQLREGLGEFLNVIVREKSLICLADLKHMQSINLSDEEWIINTWFPKIVLSGIKKLAFVTSLDYFNNASMNRIMRSTQPLVTFEIDYFVDPVDATRWLLDGNEDN
jgi:hypothetical protein